MEAVTVRGLMWVTLVEKTADEVTNCFAPAIDYAENGFPVMERGLKTGSEVAK